MSGFRKPPKSVGPADEKLVMIPPRFVGISWMSLETRIDAWPPCWVEVGAQELAVEVGDHPAGKRDLDRDRVRLAEAVVDQDQAGGAPEERALCLRDEGAGTAIGEQDLALDRALRQRAERGVRVGGRAAEVRLDRLAVGAHDRGDVDDRLVERRPGAGDLHAARALQRDRAE